ncbi:methyltransferase domain-containing protein [Caldilinea sp.]|uniref:class I SAM-dependent methyltransferase n=1 Tax=Caldilinea sp. TaxID=2293560 RepID=UPI002CA41F02|nr:methyltransferase domain-containing protein [Anaerolineales bacterium]HQY93246.1 methyltransferase domain-containing protein [Caldilinea sp.]HRA68241.1 methyltransferase domain-containing protein [Caldilinea sp.]
MYTCPVTLSYHAASSLLAARRQQATRTQISPDLNRTLIDVELGEEGVRFTGGLLLAWTEVEDIAEDDAGCYACTAEGVYKIQIFSEELQRVYTLYPTAGAPTMLISGIPMHRIKETDPHQDTLSKLRALGRIRGRVLDTCTGLGYTALAAAAHADHVTTVELDPAVHAIIQQNPWSCALFDAPNLTTSIGDVAEVIEAYPDQAFDAILHDPPMFSLAGELYSLAFYHQIYRVLRKGGRLFHYIGNPESRSGATVTRGVLKRLSEAGFQRLQDRPQAFGVTAVK